MRTNAGPTPIENNKELPSQLEVTRTPLYNQSGFNNKYNNNPGLFNNNDHNPNVIYVPQQVIIVEKHTNHRHKHEGYPKLYQGTAILILLLNVFFPGIGTMLIGCISGENVLNWICIGIAQLLLSWIIIGWVWAIITGVMLISNSE